MQNWQRTDDIYPRLVELRRDFHRHPELAFREAETAKRIMAELDRLDIPYRYDGVGGAVVGEINNGPGPTVALRADMDALPGEEATGLPFRSQEPGRMHACGHDAHMTMVLGGAMLLKRDPPQGRVLLVFQPAEEAGGGAKVVLESGVLDGCAAIFGGHVTQQYKVGQILATPGVMTAQSDDFGIRIKGRGGHGARPHEATDAIIVASMLVTALQTLVSRETNPFHPSVVTIGRIQGGTAANMIAEDALLEGSIRTTSPSGRREILDGLNRMACAMGELHRAKVKVDVTEGYPPVINTHRESRIAQAAAIETVGERGIVEMEYPSMGSEDFAFYLQEMPGCYVRFGAQLPDKAPVPLHSPRFTVNEEALKVGASFFDRVAREALEQYAQQGAPS